MVILHLLRLRLKGHIQVWCVLVFVVNFQDLRNAKSKFEQARFNLVNHLTASRSIQSICHESITWANANVLILQMTALTNSEAKKKFEFLETVNGTMDAHLRYFKQVTKREHFSVIRISI